MRILFAIALLMLPVIALPARADRPPMTPTPSVQRNEACWAELEAQARVTDGDYDGAVQAERQAETDRHEADRYEKIARTQKR